MEEKRDDKNRKKKTEIENSFEMKETNGKEKMATGCKF